LVILFVGAAEYTSRPQFCPTCHYMRPFYEGWKQSSHSNVPCMKCHYPPGLQGTLRAKVEGLLQVGRYLTQAYKKSKPWAEIPDESCLQSGCHETRLLHGQVIFKTVKFNHRPHLTQLRRNKKLRCTSCHSQIVQGAHITVTETTCFICHFKGDHQALETAKCTLCHDPPVRTSDGDKVPYDHTKVLERGLKCQRCHGEMVVGDAAVPKERCFTCHWEEDRLRRYGETEFLHKRHVTDRKVECNQCHLEIQHKRPSPERAYTALDCRTCHDQFHQAQVTLFTGRGVPGAKPVPNPMFTRGLGCQGCHVFHETIEGFGEFGQTLVAKPQSCEQCHGKGFGRLMRLWQKSSNERLSELYRIYQRVEKQLRELSTNAKFSKAQSLLAEAKDYLDLVKHGRSIHNVQYANELFDLAYAKMQKALVLVGAASRLPPLRSSRAVVPSACATCHTGIEEIEVPVFGIKYSHKPHLTIGRLKCSTCHSNERRHGELIITREKCLECHHTKLEEKCETCHRTQMQVFSGQVKFTQEVSPDVMFEAEIDCEGCHRSDEGQIVRPNAQTCANCHDPGYGDILGDWQSSTQEALEALRSALKQFPTAGLTPEQEAAAEEARRVIRLVEQDGSRGVHNYELIESLLSGAQEKINKALSK